MARPGDAGVTPWHAPDPTAGSVPINRFLWDTIPTCCLPFGSNTQAPRHHSFFGLQGRQRPMIRIRDVPPVFADDVVVRMNCALGT